MLHLLLTNIAPVPNQKTMLKILFIIGFLFESLKATSVFLDLNQHSECNQVDNSLANEAAEFARQRAEFVHWSSQRIGSILNRNNSKFLTAVYLF